MSLTSFERGPGRCVKHGSVSVAFRASVAVGCRSRSMKARAALPSLCCRRWMMPSGRTSRLRPAAGRSSVPACTSWRSVGSGSRATPAPTSTAFLMFSMLSNSSTTSTVTPCSRRKRSTSRRMTSPLSKATYFSPSRRAGRDALESRQRVPGGAGHDHLLLAPGQHGQLARPAGERHQAEVGRSVADPLVDLVGVQVLDLHLRIPVVGLEALDVLAHVAEADRVDGGHANGQGPFARAPGGATTSSSVYCSSSLLQPS